VVEKVAARQGLEVDDSPKRMTFSEALAHIKAGDCVARRGWNGEGMYVFLVDGSTFCVNRPPLNQMFPEGTEITYRSHIDMRAADGSIGVWVPSQTDILAEDWYIVS
jgi:hypothetical protein